VVFELRALALFAYLSLTCTVPAFAQQAAPDQAAPDIVVEGSRLDEMVRSFVTDVAAAPISERQIARWDQAICPLVVGLPARQAQYIADRIAQRAHFLGLRTRSSGCHANILILVTPDANQLAETLVRTNRDYTGYFVSNGLNSLGREGLARFVSSAAPVRWWHVNQTVTIDGQPLGADVGAPAIRTTTPLSRLRRTTRQDLAHAIIIVDARQANGVSMQALADYLAMVALAQINEGGKVENAPTILSLFDDRESGLTPPAALTIWDLAYLDGLYHAQRAAPNELWQRRDISSRMIQTMTPQRESPQ